MYCKIKNIECPNAGQITLAGVKEFNAKEGDYRYTVCYEQGGLINCKRENGVIGNHASFRS